MPPKEIFQKEELQKPVKRFKKQQIETLKLIFCFSPPCPKINEEMTKSLSVKLSDPPS
jgi:hypothetical protein